jgi:hypothetical protein
MNEGVCHAREAKHHSHTDGYSAFLMLWDAMASSVMQETETQVTQNSILKPLSAFSGLLLIPFQPLKARNKRKHKQKKRREGVYMFGERKRQT